MFRKIRPKILSGMAASSGSARGKAFIVNYISELRTFPDGSILVANETDPSMVLAMSKAAAIITNKGGITSHAAIVSRELGIPCVVGVKDATRVIPHAAEIIVEGDTGQITIT